ncbi:MAG: class I SAM-dependent methyltransferase, partial [Oscillospiraceae bacterium]
MAYNEFAYFYDEFNDDANYQSLFSYIKRNFEKYGVFDGIVADLGCGTGDLTLLLAEAGYDMIGVDLSQEMLSVLRDKAEQVGKNDILLLQQNLLKLDLYGTIKAAVSTFDTFNHIGNYDMFSKALMRASLFIEPNGVFIFDLNTIYKQQQVLADNTFILEADDARCKWENHYDEIEARTLIKINITYKEEKTSFNENFYEYAFTQSQINDACEAAGLYITEICDGETFTQLREDSQRYLITAIK